MKRKLLAFIFSCFFIGRSSAQAPFATMDSIDINNINALILVHGDMFWNPALGVAHCYFPKNAPTSINFVSALWMSGYDAGGNLHVAAQTYRQKGNDYWPGPLDASDTLTYATAQNWAKIWKVNNSDIQYFRSLSTHTIINTPQSILTWPGKGNTHAAGNAGAPLTITNDMAPFVDLNGNGIYEPLSGEYPDIKGDQALWWVFSDNGPTHTETNGKPLDIEVHAMSYAYNRGTLIDNVVYFDYNIINKSTNNYSNFRVGEFDDVDLGWYFDDFIGFDSTHRMGIQYNGDSDDGAGGGHPINSFGTHIPIVGMTMIVLPGDTGTSYIPAGGFYYFNNDASVIGNPNSDTQYDYYLRGKQNNGVSFYDLFSAYPQCQYHDSAQYYCYSGNPSDTSLCSECALNHMPGDRRFIVAANNFTFSAGASQHIVMAMVTTYPDSLNGCPSASFDSINIVADTAWADYYNPLPVLTAVSNIATGSSINIYPNPAHDVLYIETNVNLISDESISVYNTLGQKMDLPITPNGTGDIVNVSSLPAAMYYIIYRKDNVQKMAKFVKQ